jgi:hypothetical protein
VPDLNRRKGADLIGSHHTAIADNICGKDCGEATSWSLF